LLYKSLKGQRQRWPFFDRGIFLKRDSIGPAYDIRKQWRGTTITVDNLKSIHLSNNGWNPQDGEES
jgi:hypothetical protein